MPLTAAGRSVDEDDVAAIRRKVGAPLGTTIRFAAVPLGVAAAVKVGLCTGLGRREAGTGLASRLGGWTMWSCPGFPDVLLVKGALIATDVDTSIH